MREPLEKFEPRMVAGAGAEIFVRTGGEGPPLLLLHGYPQTHVMWHRLAPVLARHFHLVIADLRGYGRSSMPKNDRDNRDLFEARHGGRHGGGDGRPGPRPLRRGGS